MVTDRAWVRMPSGKHLNLLDPTPLDWEDSDLAIGLARTYRWGGHSIWPLPLSVAQHSLAVMYYRMRHSATPLSAKELLAELCHDADEGLLGFDCIASLKPFMGAEFHAMTQRLDDAIRLRYGLPAWTDQTFRIHKKVDRVMAATEALHVAGWGIEEIKHTLKIPYEPLNVDILSDVYHCEPWAPWEPDVAASRFLTELQRLLLMI